MKEASKAVSDGFPGLPKMTRGIKKAAPFRLQLDAPWGSACECFVFVAERLAGTDRLDFRQCTADLLHCQPIASKIMARVLGLDIGTNSIGWAIVEVDVENHPTALIAMGTRVFPEGVDRDTSGAEKSKNESRRIARGMRRQIARRARRRKAMRRALVEAELFPATSEEQIVLMQMDPYQLRNDALVRQLHTFEIGRILLHMAQRRGFLSNRKTDRGKSAENKGLLKEISELAAQIGEKTLGQFFHEQRESNPQERVRGNHTRRQMYMDELQRIWDFQSQFYPDLLTDALRFGHRGETNYPREPEPLRNRREKTLLQEFGLHGILFFQRSMYWPASIVGRCELEPSEKRCRRADRLAQRFRLLQEVNNLRIIPEFAEPRELRPEERSTVLKQLETSDKRSFDDLRSSLGLLRSDSFNLERGDRKNLQGLPIDHALANKKYFGKAWARLAEKTRNDIVRSLLDDEAEAVLNKAINEWGCTEELAVALCAFDPTDLVDGYTSYSQKAMEKLLPHLERGLRMMANDEKDSALHAAGYLRPDEKVVRQSDRLPGVPESIVNPIVRQAMYEVRKLVHAVIRVHGKPDRIHIELAREASGNAEQRSKQISEMRQREKRRDDAAHQIREWGHNVTGNNIDLYTLWLEQGKECVYSGRPISPHQLFGGEVDVDHILPRSRSLDNSLMNRVVVFRSENSAKGQRTPYEWLADTNPEKYGRVLQSARKLPMPKRRRFAQKELKLDDFLNRHLTDTAYITTCVRQYLLTLGCDIVCTKGQSTADLRRIWGLNTVLRNDGLNLKPRGDHRHHAIDALVIALTSRSILQTLARVYSGREAKFPQFWPTFRSDVEESVASINVSHRVSRGITGALHEDTIYGRTQKKDRSDAIESQRPHSEGWVESEGVFVIRKSLESLTPPMIDEIRDPNVKRIIIDRLHSLGVDDYRRLKKLPGDWYKEPLFMSRKKGRLTKAPNVIKSVRVFRKDLTIQPIRRGSACVKPGNTHHISIFEMPGSTPENPKRDVVAVTMLEVAHLQHLARQRHRIEPLINRIHPTSPDAKFLFSLSLNEAVVGTFAGIDGVFIYNTTASTTKQMRFYLHTDARKKSEARGFTAKPNSMQFRKVTVNLLGDIRDAND